MSQTAAHRVTSKYKLLAGLPLRQETDGSQIEQVESVPCGQILQDKDNSRKEEKLSPVQIRGKKTTCSSFLRSRRPSNYMCTGRLLRGQIGRGHHHIVSDVNLPVASSLESTLAKRCRGTHGRTLR